MSTSSRNRRTRQPEDVDELAAVPDKVIVDPALLRSAVVNLVANARDAMMTGGVVKLTTRSMVIRPETIDEPDLTPGRYIVIAISDSGIGMSENVLRRAREPFFTTKGGQGTGLGLWQVQSFVHHAGGAAHIESALGKGTTVRLYLPEAPARPSPATR